MLFYCMTNAVLDEFKFYAMIFYQNRTGTFLGLFVYTLLKVHELIL